MQAQKQAMQNSSSTAPNAVGYSSQAGPAVMGQSTSAGFGYSAPGSGQLGFGNKIQAGFAPPPMMAGPTPQGGQQMFTPAPLYGNPANPYGAPPQAQPAGLPLGFTSM